ncbi:hypothetical protein [Archaeoglobus neptunius]|uniref:hypothetical protein n=1 Tax=Archaeoglobus neptunius TaxID=2798580 RepID=UPI0019254B9E|nr:hypothetical protein [Archaeoglobus neptunius]
MKLTIIRDPFVVAEVLGELKINLRKRIDTTYLQSLFYLFADRLELNYVFKIKNDVVFSKALEEDLKLLRAIGTSLLPRKLVDSTTTNAIKTSAEHFTEAELTTLAKIKAEMDGIAPNYLTRRRESLEKWYQFCSRIGDQNVRTPLAETPIPR